jgi:hypothetical protein
MKKKIHSNLNGSIKQVKNIVHQFLKPLYVAKAQIELADESSTAAHPVNKKHLEMCDKFERVRKGIVDDWSW